MKNAGKSVLFVEDNPLVITIYRNWLQREGFQVDSSSDGLDAIEKLPQMKPSLVILDLMLPMLDGMDVLKFIRENGDLKATPVLILSNAYMDDRAEKALNAGANKILLKTQCTPARLIQAVRELLGVDALTQNSAAHPAVQSSLAAANEALLKETRENLLTDAPGEVAKIREHCLAFVKAAGTPAGTEHLNSMYQRVRFLCARAGLGDCSKIAHLASALEAMLFEIMFKKSSPSASALQTIAQSVDCLGRLFQSDDVQSAETIFKAKVLVVDDDPVCTFATVAAMKRAKLEAVSTLDPAVALQMAQQDRYDIVLLDINMPGMNGFEVCEKIRKLPDYQKTPVIFVTSNSEFQNRAQAVLSGGDDLIAKPISPLELALKTIIHLIDPSDVARPTTPKTETKTVVPAETVPVNEPAKLTPKIKFEMGRKPDAVVPLPPPRPVENDHSRPLSPPPLPSLHRNGITVATTDISEPRIPMPAASIVKLPHENGASKDKIEMPMKNQTESPTLDKLTNEIAGIMFGDKVCDMSLRLTRIALDRCNILEVIQQPADGSGKNPLDRVAREVAEIIFGDDKVSEMHLRLMRIALERYNVPAIINGSEEIAPRNGSHVELKITA
jgi:CheY-like chemotaxis protein